MDYWGLSVPEDEDEDTAAGTASTRSAPIMPLLKDIRKSHSLLGLDIGGTLAKLVIALPDDEKDSTAETSNNSPALEPIVDEAAAASTRLRNIPPSFGATGQCPPELAFRATLCGRAWRLQFLRGATQLLGGLQLPADSAAAASASPSNSSSLRQVVAAGGGAHKFKALFRSSLGIELVALKEFQSLVDGLRFLHAQRPAGELYTVVPDKSGHSTEGETRELPASAELEKSGAPFSKAEASPTSSSSSSTGNDIAGAADRAKASSAAKPSELPQTPPPAPFSPSPRWVEEEVAWPSPLYPFLLVSFGSGVSVLQVNSAAEADFERVGGTATGGATFLGLMHLLTGKPSLSFDDAVACAARGNAANVDKLVGDIYGADGCANLELPPTMTAANFGKVAAVREIPTPATNSSSICGNKSGNNSKSSKLASSGRSTSDDSGAGEDDDDHQGWPPSEADVAAATLQMIAQASAVLVRTIAQQAKCLTRVFVVGGFMDANPLARAAFAQNLSALNGRALFVAHSGFLGALGSLQRCATDYSSNNTNASGKVSGNGSGNGVNSSGSAVGSRNGNSIRRQLDPASYPWDLGVVPTTTSSDANNDNSSSKNNGSSEGNSTLQEHVWSGTWVRPVACPTSQAAQQAAPASSPTSASSCDANAWWQLGMLWAYAASAAQLRHLVEDYCGSTDHNSHRLHSANEGGAVATPEPFPVPASTAHNKGAKDQQRVSAPNSPSSASPPPPPSPPPGCGCALCGDWRWSEAQRCLDKCAQLEPRCALAFWALAWTHGHKPLHSDLVGSTDSSSSGRGSDTSNRRDNHSSSRKSSGGSDSSSPRTTTSSSQAKGECLLSYEGAHFAGRRALALVRTQPSPPPSSSSAVNGTAVGADEVDQSTAASAGDTSQEGRADEPRTLNRAAGQIPAAQMAKAEAALIEATALRFAVWPPSSFASHLHLAFAAAVTEAQQEHPKDPDIAAVAIRARFDARVASLRALPPRVPSERDVHVREWDAAVVEAIEALELAHAQHPSHAGILLMLHALLPALVGGASLLGSSDSILTCAHADATLLAVARAEAEQRAASTDFANARTAGLRAQNTAETLLLPPGSNARALWAKSRQEEVSAAIAGQAPHSAALLFDPQITWRRPNNNLASSAPHQYPLGNATACDSNSTPGIAASGISRSTSSNISKCEGDQKIGSEPSTSLQSLSSTEANQPDQRHSSAREDRDAVAELLPSLASLHASSGRIRGMSYGAVD